MDTKRSLSAISELFKDYDFLHDNLIKKEPSVAQNLIRHLTKMLVLSCASYYENFVIECIVKYSQCHSKKYKSNPHGFDTIAKRSFFQMFDFGRERPNKPNAFFGPLDYFGKDFRETIVEEVKSSPELELQMEAFQEICRLRNSLAHNDLITADDAILNKSFSEIMVLHQNAVKFLEYFTKKIAYPQCL